MAAHDDKRIRFFDLRSSKTQLFEDKINKNNLTHEYFFAFLKDQLVKNIIAHTEAVTSLSACPNSNYLASVGHDGCMRTWDIRKYQCVHDIQVFIPTCIIIFLMNNKMNHYFLNQSLLSKQTFEYIFIYPRCTNVNLMNLSMQSNIISIFHSLQQVF